MNFNLKAIIGAFLLASAIPAVAMEIPEGFVKIGCSEENHWKAACIAEYFAMNNISLVPAVKSEAVEKHINESDNSLYAEFTKTSNGQLICHKEKTKEFLKHLATQDPKEANILAIALMNDEAVNRTLSLIVSPNPVAIHNTVFFEEIFG
jgi:hypothetical protein